MKLCYNKRFRVIVEKATEAVGVTRNYKKLLRKAGNLQAFVSNEAKDIDGYITQKSIDVLFDFIAKEEKLIRQDPVARSTELLKKVFSYFLN